MAIGDQVDVTSRLKSYLPRGWFGDFSETPVVAAVLAGTASVLSSVYTMAMSFRAQTRLATSSGGWIDIWAADFLGNASPRNSGEADAAYKTRIRIALFRKRVTRPSMSAVLLDLTGRTPLIVEPNRPLDTGAYGNGNLAYGVCGVYGDANLPYQEFVTAYLPAGTGIPNVAGYGASAGAYGVASQAEYASDSMAQSAVTAAQIYSAIESVKPAGTLIWVKILNAPTPPAGMLDISMVLDSGVLGNATNALDSMILDSATLDGGAQGNALDTSFVLDQSTLQQGATQAALDSFILDSSSLN